MFSRISVPALVIACFALCAAADDPAKSPEEVLKDAGLTRNGQSYILDDETQAVKLAREMEKVAGQLSINTQNQRMLEMAVQTERLEATQLNQMANFDRMQSRGMGYRGSMGSNSQANSLSNQARSLQSQANNQNKTLGTVNKAITDATKTYQQQQAEYKTLVDKMIRQYDELSQRAEIKDALRSINKGIHPKYALGPIPAYRVRVDRAMLDILTTKGLGLRKTVLESIEEPAFVKRAAAANAMFRDLSKKPVPSDDPRRAALAGEANDLHAQAVSLDKRQEELAKDEDVIDAIAELNLPKGRKKVHLSLSSDSRQARRIVERIIAAKE